jgi:hypothetical protein
MTRLKLKPRKYFNGGPVNPTASNSSYGNWMPSMNYGNGMKTTGNAPGGLGFGKPYYDTKSFFGRNENGGALNVTNTTQPGNSKSITYDDVSTAVNAVGSAAGAASSSIEPQDFYRYKTAPGMEATMGQATGDAVGSIVPFYGASKGVSSLFTAAAEGAENNDTSDAMAAMGGVFDHFGTRMKAVELGEKGIISKKDVSFMQGLGSMLPGMDAALMNRAERQYYKNIALDNATVSNVGGVGGNTISRRGNTMNQSISRPNYLSGNAYSFNQTGGPSTHMKGELEAGEAITEQDPTKVVERIPKSARTHAEGGEMKNLKPGQRIWASDPSMAVEFGGEEKTPAEWHKLIMSAKDLSKAQKAQALEEVWAKQEAKAGREPGEPGGEYAQTGGKMYQLAGTALPSGLPPMSPEAAVYMKKQGEVNAINQLPAFDPILNMPDKEAGAAALAEYKAKPKGYFKPLPPGVAAGGSYYDGYAEEPEDKSLGQRSKFGAAMNSAAPYGFAALAAGLGMAGHFGQKVPNYSLPKYTPATRTFTHVPRIKADLTAERAAMARALRTMELKGQGTGMQAALGTQSRAFADVTAKVNSRVEQANLGAAVEEAKMNQQDAQFTQELNRNMQRKYDEDSIALKQDQVRTRNAKLQGGMKEGSAAALAAMRYMGDERLANTIAGPETGIMKTQNNYNVQKGLRKLREANPNATDNQLYMMLIDDMKKMNYG